MNTKRLAAAAVAGALGLGLAGSVTAPVSAAEVAKKPGRNFVVKLLPRKSVVSPKGLKATGNKRIVIKTLRWQRPVALKVQAIRCNGKPLGEWKHAPRGRAVPLTKGALKRGTCFGIRWGSPGAPSPSKIWINLTY
ncbi:hypothetical protein [Actinomadura rudentiformis]|uniref:Uncharacterized protein n=1 Tax=Actinomadura rudentiformis TaxID=359158 RepID=A0A6H9YNF0_9ACTN|nr:hypothetical protein [Actinomadura rudentiformis]KAB2342159.1 hypothetical protein F8566_39555 [Actinomadura rudentiformis]